MSLARNRKAYYDYEILDKFEAGIVLNGAEIKSIRNSNLSIAESRVIVNKGEAWLVGCHVAEYKHPLKHMILFEIENYCCIKKKLIN